MTSFVPTNLNSFPAHAPSTPPRQLTMSCSTSSAAFPPPLRHLRRRPIPKTLTPNSSIRSALSDPLVLKLAETLEDSLSLSSPQSQPLQSLRESAAKSLLYKLWPSPKDEPFRFTDTSFIKNSVLLPSPPPPFDRILADSDHTHLLLVDGHVVPSPSCLPAGCYAGGISGVPNGPIRDRVLAALSSDDGDLFFDLNGVGAPDVAVIYVPEGVRVDDPVIVRFCYAEGAEVGSGRMAASNPRVVVVVEKGAEVGIVEEHLGIDGCEEKCYWANSVMEIQIDEGAKVSHLYLQRQSLDAAHIKWTFARQESSSTYELIEISTGGRLSRHNLEIQQLGPDTITEMSAFHVSHREQTQDLHSKLILNHPKGYSRQLHKCIVTHSSGHAIFDGNIKVNRFAQKTDAGQLTRTLLLAPRATVNLKPNLQIVADDVKCSHGAAISELEQDQLFYFQARGIDRQTARDALVFSFGAEVLAKIPFEPIRKSISGQVQEFLLSTKRVNG